MSPTRRDALRLAAGALVAGSLTAAADQLAEAAVDAPPRVAPAILEGQLLLTDYTAICKPPHTAPTPLILTKLSLCAGENGTVWMSVTHWSDKDQAFSDFRWLTVPPEFAVTLFAAIRP